MGKPKENVKVVYPSWSHTLFEILIFCTRGPLCATLFLYLLSPLYYSLTPKILNLISSSPLPSLISSLPFLSPSLSSSLSSPSLLFLLFLSLSIHETLFFSLNSFFLFCDKKGFLKQYKLPRNKRMTQNLDKLLFPTLKDAFIGHFIIQPLAFSLFFSLYFDSSSLILSPLSPLPSPLVIFLSFLGANFTNEILFYFVHRLMHEVPFLYRLIHKQHHQYVATIGFASEYACFIESVFANDIPTVIFCFIMEVHPLIWFVFLFWRLEETYETHSGYFFGDTFFGRIGLFNGHQAEFHDFHHSKNIGNYGHHLIDELFGTMDQWLLAKQKKE